MEKRTVDYNYIYINNIYSRLIVDRLFLYIFLFDMNNLVSVVVVLVN